MQFCEIIRAVSCNIFSIAGTYSEFSSNNLEIVHKLINFAPSFRFYDGESPKNKAVQVILQGALCGADADRARQNQLRVATG